MTVEQYLRAFYEAQVRSLLDERVSLALCTESLFGLLHFFDGLSTSVIDANLQVHEFQRSVDKRAADFQQKAALVRSQIASSQ